MKMLNKGYWPLHRLSVSLLIWPYLAQQLGDLWNSPFVSLFSLMTLIFVVLLIDWGLGLLSRFKPSIFAWVQHILLFVLLFAIYGYYLPLICKGVIHSIFGVYVRGRWILAVLVLLILGLQGSVGRRQGFFAKFNTFLLLFGCVNLISGCYAIIQKPIHNEALTGGAVWPLMKTTNKPTLLLIADEYHSPQGLFAWCKDSTVFDFSAQLQKEGWWVNNKFPTLETKTLYSLGSLFNMNQSRGGHFHQMDPYRVVQTQLIRSLLYDHLHSKGVSVLNLGIFNVGASKPLCSFYRFPQGFWELLFYHTALRELWDNTNGLSVEGFGSAYFTTSKHNEYIVEHLADTLRRTQGAPFVYAHLLMPHSPMIFKSEFLNNGDYTLDNYYPYWQFTNQKLSKLLHSLTHELGYRVILTGDHGYRDDQRLNPHHTFAACFGFDTQALSQVKCVQDFGLLINAGYK